MDLISRQAVGDALNGIEISRNASWYEFYQKALTAVGELPSAQPDVPDTNVGDMISRQAAMDEVESIVDTMSVCISMDEYKGMRRMKENVLERLKALPFAQPGWIPTSERLPDNDRAVLVTLKWAEDDYEVAVGEYWHNSTASHGWGSFEGHVIAWHELPTPYREGEQDDT